MYKKIMVFGMVLLIMLCTPLPSYADLGKIDSTVLNRCLQKIVQSGYLNTYKHFAIVENCYDETFDGVYIYFYDYSSNGAVSTHNIKLLSNTNELIFFKYNFSTSDFEGGYTASFSDTFQTTYNSTYKTTNNFLRIRYNSETLLGKAYKDFTDYRGGIKYPTHTIKRDALGNFVSIESYSEPSNQSFDGRITLPANDGYKDNGTTFTFWHWYQLPTGVDSSDVKIDPYIDDSKDTYHSASVTLHQKIPNTSKWNLNINLTVRDYGPHTYKVVFKQISTGKVLGTLTRTFEALEGFIDENGDGLDDRTGQPPYDPLEPPGDSLTPEWDGTILGFFQYLIDSVKYYVQNIVDGINVTMGAIGKVPQIMGTILNFPEPLTALLIFGVTCTIILAIFRR